MAEYLFHQIWNGNWLFHLKDIETYPQVLQMTKNGCSLLQRAVYQDWINTARTLLDAGASPDASFDNGKPPLYWLAKNATFSSIWVKMFIQAGADTRSLSKSIVEKLIIGFITTACGRMIRTITDQGWDLNDFEIPGDSLIDVCYHLGHILLLQELFECGLSPNYRISQARIIKNKTPFILTIKHPTYIASFIDYGALDILDDVLRIMIDTGDLDYTLVILYSVCL